MFLFTVTVTLQGADDSYRFPVRGGMEEWKTFTSHVQMLEACTVPENVLATMSTEGLIETCMDYPLKNDLGNYNDFQNGFECVMSGFNGLQELLKRNDAGKKLTAFYRTMKPGAFERNLSIAGKGFYAFDIMYVEMMLSQAQVLDNLTAQEQKELLILCLEKAEERTSYQDVYDDSRFHIGWALLVGRLLQKQNYQLQSETITESKLNHFLKHGNTDISNDILQEIHFNGKAFLDPAIKKRGYSPIKPFLPAAPKEIMKDTTIKTPNGSIYRTTVKHSETESINQLKSWFAANERDYPLIVPLEPFASREYGTSRFNCHSYACFWEDVEPGVTVWINDIRAFVDDESLAERDDTTNGCRVVLWQRDVGSYPVHTMTLVPNEGREVTSKWGNNAVYAHDYDYHCYNFQESTPYDYCDVTNGPYDITDINTKEMFGKIPFDRNARVVKGMLIINIPEPASFAVYTMAGKLVYKERQFKNNRAVINLTKCPAGIYAVKQTNKNNGIRFFKVALGD
jgi:hypothetical protein